jgi:hypothetical protein
MLFKINGSNLGYFFISKFYIELQLIMSFQNVNFELKIPCVLFIFQY